MGESEKKKKSFIKYYIMQFVAKCNIIYYQQRHSTEV